MNFGAETHLGGGVISTFVFPWLPLLKHPASTVIGSTALRKGPLIHCHYYHRSLMLTCQNSPWWQSC